MSGPDAKSRLRLWLRLLKSSRMIESRLRENLRRDYGSTLPRFDVLAALHRHEGGLKMSELSGVLKVSNGNVTGIVDRLEEDGMVERQAVEGDRRASRARLTTAGRAHFKELATAHESWIDQLLEDFTEAEAEQVSTRLHRLNERIEGETG